MHARMICKFFGSDFARYRERRLKLLTKEERLAP
jgi:hypothetical protein